MKSSKVIKITLSLVLLNVVCPSTLRADLSVLFFDNFDDGDYVGWSAVYPGSGVPADPPDIVTSPEGYSLRGVGSGYSGPANTWLTRDFLLSNVGELEIEMRAISGSGWPNAAWVSLYNGYDSYYFHVSGEGHNYAQWSSSIGGVEVLRNFSFNPNAWHNYSWTRDADGWWSLNIDGSLVWEDFWQDNQLTSFTELGLGLTRNQSEIEWMRISGTVVPVPGAVLLGMLGLSVAGWKLRRFA